MDKNQIDTHPDDEVEVLEDIDPNTAIEISWVQTAFEEIIVGEPFEIPGSDIIFNSYSIPWGFGLLKFDLVIHWEPRIITFSFVNGKISFPGFIEPRPEDFDLITQITQSRYWHALQKTHHSQIINTPKLKMKEKLKTSFTINGINVDVIKIWSEWSNVKMSINSSFYTGTLWFNPNLDKKFIRKTGRSISDNNFLQLIMMINYVCNNCKSLGFDNIKALKGLA